MDEAEIVFLKRAGCFYFWLCCVRFDRKELSCRRRREQESGKAIFVFLARNIPQHPSENIYSVLAFINILLKQQQQKPGERTNRTREELFQR